MFAKGNCGTCHSTASRGVTVLLVIAYMGIFLLILGTLSSFALEEGTYGRALEGREQALAIAEAGLEYYRWYLAHFPNTTTSTTYQVNDPETGGGLGSAAVTAVGNKQCGQIQSIDITSVGTANVDPGFPRKLSARYMEPSVANYSYLLNSNVWAGSDRNITGQYFSNGGIRMDGTNNSLVSSALSTWDCNSSYGCSPEQTTAPGVVGSGSGSALWSYPAASINFTNMQANLANLKSYAQNSGGLYFAPASGSASQRGYHLIFNGDGTVTVKQVTATIGVPSYSYDVNDLSRYYTSGGKQVFGYWTENSSGVPQPTEYSIIKTESLVGTYTVPSSCSLIFVEDRVWVEGTVKGKVTVVAAVPSQGIQQSVPVNAYLPNNVTYATTDGSSGLTVIAQDSINIPLNAPSNLTLNGIFVAQGGVYGRNYYDGTASDCYRSGGTQYNYCVQSVNSSYASMVLGSTLTTDGSVVSNQRTGTSWSSGGSTVSGYQTRVDAYDELQATNPPPFTPAASTNYQFVLWKEE